MQDNDYADDEEVSDNAAFEQEVMEKELAVVEEECDEKTTGAATAPKKKKTKKVRVARNNKISAKQLLFLPGTHISFSFFQIFLAQ